MGAPKGGGPEGWGPRRVGAPKGGGPEGWGPEGWGPEGWGPEGWGPEGWRFFFPSPATVFILFSLSFGPSRGILVFEAPGRSNVHVWSSRAVVCGPRRPGLVGPPGFHTTAREPKRAHLRVPAFKNTTKIQRERPKEREKRMKTVTGEGKKKSEILGGPAEGGPAEGGPAEGGSGGRGSGGRGSGGGGFGGGALNTPTHTQHNNNNNTNNNTTQQQHNTQQHRNTQHRNTQHNNNNNT